MPGTIVETDDQLVLRTVERDDAEFLQRLYTDPWARSSLHVAGHKTRAETEDEIEERIEDDDVAAYVACIEETDETTRTYGHPEAGETTPVAAVIATSLDWDRPNVIRWVVPEHRGEGYGERALSLAVNSVFRTYDAHSIGARVLGGDRRSRDDAESIGFVHEGTLREVQFVEGEYRDQHEYGRLREEWDLDAPEEDQ